MDALQAVWNFLWAAFLPLLLLVVAAELLYLIRLLRKGLWDLDGQIGALINLTAQKQDPASLTGWESKAATATTSTAQSLAELNMNLKLLNDSLDKAAAGPGGGNGKDVELARRLDDLNGSLHQLLILLSKLPVTMEHSQQVIVNRLETYLDEQQMQLAELVRSVGQPSSETMAAPVIQRVRPELAAGDAPPDLGGRSLTTGAAAAAVARADQPPQRVAPEARGAAGADEKFGQLREWVEANIESIMRRGKSSVTEAEELLADIPADLQPRAQMIDPHGKLLLLRTGDSAQALAVALPGAYVGGQFYEWFTTKGTTNRVQGTIKPALVRQDGDQYQVLSPGTLAQD